MNEEELAASPHLQEYPTFMEIYYILYYIILYYDELLKKVYQSTYQI